MATSVNAFDFLRSRSGVFAAAIWAVYVLGGVLISRWFRSLKDPADYTGVCYKSSGYAVKCSLEAWLNWDATPYIEIYYFIGAIAAAAATGYLFVLFYRRN